MQRFAVVPTYIGSANGARFYEHPKYGDEVPMIMRVGNSDLYIDTEFYELEGAVAELTA